MHCVPIFDHSIVKIPRNKVQQSIEDNQTDAAMSKIFHSLIIGGGPAGLSVALGLSRLNKSCLVISHGTFRNDGIEASHAVLGHDHIHPQTTWAKGREQIDRYGTTTYENAEIVSAEKSGDDQTFVINSKDGRSWTGRTLVLAAGVRDILPELPGYKENWPRNIYQCPFCDGWERKDADKAVIGINGFGMNELMMARMITNFDPAHPEKVTVMSNGHNHDDKDEAVSKSIQTLTKMGVKFDSRKIGRLINAEPEEGVDIVFEDGTKDRVGFIMHKPQVALNAEGVIKQLGVETGPAMFGDVVKTKSPFQDTNVPGVYVAGDLGNAMTHVTLALSTGVASAAGIVHYLNQQEDRQAALPKPVGDADALACKT